MKLKQVESFGSKIKEYSDVKLQGITQQIIQPVHSFRDIKAVSLKNHLFITQMNFSIHM